jgi:hypothetical protein
MTDIAKALNDFVVARKGEALIPVKVVSVDDVNCTCDVVDVEGNETFDVRLRAAIEGDDEGFVLIPKLDSWVLMANIGHQPNAWAVVMYSFVTKLQYRVSSVSLRVDQDGMLLKKGSTNNLATMMQDLFTELNSLTTQLQALTVTCASPGSPSSPPLNVAAFATIATNLNGLKTKFNNLLKAS